MSVLKKYSSALALLLLSFIFLHILLPDLIYKPGEFLLAKSGDGLKSYFVLNYHLKYDDSLLQFNGMNYPYGDNYLFSDGFPAITFLIQLLPFLKPFAFQIIHWSILLGLLVTPLLLFKILKKYKVQTWLAIVGALALFSLQPQFPRIFGHLSLSYACFFPLAWYLLLKFNESQNKWRWTLIISLNTLFWFFLHGYLGFMITLFYLVYFLIKFIKKAENKRNLLQLAIFTLVPVMLFFLISKFSDQVNDRPDNPYGFFDYQAHWKSIFLPNVGFLHDQLVPAVNFEKVTWEGSAYIGTMSVLILIIVLIISVTKRFNKRVTINFFPSDLLFVFLSGAILLVYSLGFPFNQFPELLDYLSPLKQFRALGRFSWPFYYTSGILAFVFMNNITQQFSTSKIKHGISIALVSLSCSIYFFDSSPFLEFLSKSSTENQFCKNVFNAKHLSNEEKEMIAFIEKNKTNYQAILPLPWFHIGSEMYGKEPAEKTLWNTFILSSHTGIPIYAMLMGRTSLSQTEEYFRSFYSDLKLNNNKRIGNRDFLIWFNGDALYLEDEQVVYDHSKLVLKNSLGELRSISTEQFQNVPMKNISTQEKIYQENFSDKARWGANFHKNRYRGRVQDFNIITKLDSTVLKPNQRYEVSFEYFWVGKKSLSNVLIMEYINPSNEVLWFYTRPICSYPGQFKDKVKVRAVIQTQPLPCMYNIFLNAKGDGVEFEVDNLVITPLD